MTGADYRDRRVPPRPLPQVTRPEHRPTGTVGPVTHSDHQAARVVDPRVHEPRAHHPRLATAAAPPPEPRLAQPYPDQRAAPREAYSPEAASDMAFAAASAYPPEDEAEVYYQFGAETQTVLRRAPRSEAADHAARHAAPRAYAQAEAQTSHVSHYTPTPRVYTRQQSEAAPLERAARDAQAPHDFTTPFASAPRPIGRGQKLINILGAAGSVALVVSLGWWGWELAMRDIHGVPVIRALEGPMRIKPVEAGGSVVNHQGLSVNDVSARDGSLASEDVRLAPAPTLLTEEDSAGLKDLPPLDSDVAQIEAAAAEAARAGDAPLSDLTPETDTEAADPTGAEPPAPIALSQEDAVAAALAEAMGLSSAPNEAALSAEAAPVEEAGAIARTPRPLARPDSLPMPTVQAAAPREIDGASLAIGTRLVQFGAFDSPDLARAEWERISAALGPLMSGKALVLQSAISGGQTFWRLRGHGFENEDHARRFCSSAISDGVNCIPVSHR